MGRSMMVFLAATVLAGSAFAEEKQENTATNTSNVKTSDVATEQNQPKDSDEEVTNARMRAQMGSKSRVSIKTAFSYSGGSVEKPFDRIRPNYQAGRGVDSLSSLGGTIGINYRMDNGDSLSLGTGLSIANPFHGDLTRNNMVDPRDGTSTVKRADLSNPSLSWGRNYKAAGMQMQTSASATYYTTQTATKIYNGIGDIDFGQTALLDFGTSGWSGGISAAIQTAFYKGDAPIRTSRSGVKSRPGQGELYLGVYPFAEYSFNDKYSFRTVFGYFSNTRYRKQAGEITGDAAAVEADVPYQSMGLGISLTRDIYLYPNVQFTPFDIRADRTNVALSANVNMF